MNKLLDLDYTKIDARDRRLVLFATESRKKEIAKSKTYIRHLLEWVPVIAINTFLPHSAIAYFIAKTYLFPPSKETIKSDLDTWQIVVVKGVPIPVFDLVNSRDQFKFPPNHPVDGTTYACCDYEPLLYVPVAVFHVYMREMKQKAFVDLCMKLGAKSIRTLYSNDRKKSAGGNVDVPLPQGDGMIGVKADYSEQHKEDGTISYKFDQPKTGYLLEETTKGWIHSEQSWQAMQEGRLRRGLSKFKAEMSFYDEMGINKDLSVKIQGFKLGLGGNFHEVSEEHFEYEVEFWPVP